MSANLCVCVADFLGSGVLAFKAALTHSLTQESGVVVQLVWCAFSFRCIVAVIVPQQGIVARLHRSYVILVFDCVVAIVSSRHPLGGL